MVRAKDVITAHINRFQNLTFCEMSKRRRNSRFIFHYWSKIRFFFPSTFRTSNTQKLRSILCFPFLCVLCWLPWGLLGRGSWMIRRSINRDRVEKETDALEVKTLLRFPFKKLFSDADHKCRVSKLKDHKFQIFMATTILKWVMKKLVWEIGLI